MFDLHRFFLLPQLGTNRIKSFSNNIHFVKSRKQYFWSNWTIKISFVKDICHKSGQRNSSKSKSPEKSVVEMSNKSFLTVLGRASLYYGTLRKWRPSRKEQDLFKGDHARSGKSGKHLQGSTNARVSNVKVKILKWI